jgi:hypothetical protein
MEQKRKGPTDAEMNANWDALLKEFHGIWENSPKDFTKFEALKEKAKLTPLTGRQIEGIIDRCNNVIKGQYGNTKKGIEFKAS